MELVQILSGKNQLAAVIHRPVKPTEKLAILCPGFLDSKDYNGLKLLAQNLESEGYTVVRFDPTGTWDSKGSIEEYTTTQYLEDIKKVLEYMINERPYKYILLGGHSRGAQMSLLYAAQDPRISLVVAIMPSSPLTLDLERREKWRKNGFHNSTRNIPGASDSKEYSVPFAYVLDEAKYNVLSDIPKIHVPIIFVAGELDRTVLPKHVKSIYDLANEPKKFILVKGVGHDYRHNLKEVQDVNRKIVKELMFR